MKIKHEIFGDCYLTLLRNNDSEDHYLLISKEELKYEFFNNIRSSYYNDGINIDQICNSYSEILGCFDFNSSKCPINYIGI